MADAATLGVLKDVVYIAFLALIIGAGAYALTRVLSPVTAWNFSGKVVSRPYEWPDAVVAMLLTLVLVFMSGVLSGPAVEAKTSEVAPSPSEAAQAGSIALMIIVDLMLVSLVVGFLRVVREFDPGELFGLRRMKPARAFTVAVMWIIPAWFVVWGVAVASSALLDGVWPDLGAQSSVKLLEGTGSPLVKLLMSVTAIMVAPLTEELMFRGVLFGVFKRYTDTYFAGLVSAVLFASIHSHVGTFLPLFALGLIFVAAYEVTGCLLVTIFMHALFNGSQVVLMLFGVE